MTIGKLGTSLIFLSGLLSHQPRALAADVCKEDLEKYCAHKEWDAGMTECIEQNKRHFSSECRHHWEDVRMKQVEKNPETRKRTGASCKDDGERLCRGLRKGRKFWNCLKDHKSELAEDCRGLVDRRFRK